MDWTKLRTPEQQAERDRLAAWKVETKDYACPRHPEINLVRTVAIGSLYCYLCLQSHSLDQLTRRS